MSSDAVGARPEAPAGTRLARVLRRARLRLRLRRAAEQAARLLPWFAAVAAIAVAAQRLAAWRSPVPLTPGALILAAAGIAVLPPIAAAIAAAVATRIPDLGVALLVDRGLGLRERATAAIALRNDEDADGWAQRALDALGTARVAEALPWRPLPWRRSVVATAAACAAFALPPWPAAQAPPPQEPDPQVVAAAERLEKEAEAVAKELDERGASEEAQRVLQEVQRTAERAKVEPMAREEAVAELQRIDQQARREQERREAADAGALQRALSSLEQATLQRDAAREAGTEEATSLEQQLKSLAEQFSQGVKFEERDTKRMAARLRDAAEALQASHPDLAEKLEQLAQAIEQGDSQRAAELAKELAMSAELQQLSADAATGEALQEARRLVQQAMAAMGHAPTDQELAEAKEQGRGQGDEPGDGEGEGQGDGEGRGGGDKPGDGRGGRDRSGKSVVQTDWGVGSTNEATPESPLAQRGLQQDRQSTETSDWREAYEALYESTHLESARARSTRVRGELGEGELIAVESRQTAQGPESAALPGVRLPPRYERAAEEALAREEVPGAYRDAVRRYFTSLDAPAGRTAAPSPPAQPPTNPPEKK